MEIIEKIRDAFTTYKEKLSDILSFQLLYAGIVAIIGAIFGILLSAAFLPTSIVPSKPERISDVIKLFSDFFNQVITGLTSPATVLILVALAFVCLYLKLFLLAAYKDIKEGINIGKAIDESYDAYLYAIFYLIIIGIIYGVVGKILLLIPVIGNLLFNLFALWALSTVFLPLYDVIERKNTIEAVRFTFSKRNMRRGPIYLGILITFGVLLLFSVQFFIVGIALSLFVFTPLTALIGWNLYRE